MIAKLRRQGWRFGAVILVLASSRVGAQITGVSATAAETLYFYEVGGELRGSVQLTLASARAAAVPARARVTAGGETVETSLTIPVGSSKAIVHAPVIFPRPPQEAVVVLEVEGQVLQLTTPLGKERPWTIYICQDKHLDYGWQYNFPTMTSLMNEVVRFYVESATSSLSLPEEDQHHYNFDVSLWADEYLRTQPAAARDELAARLRSRHIATGGLYAINLTATLSTEETLRSLYFARQLERDLGSRLSFMSPNEVPTISWGLATIARQAGIPYLGKGICNCPSYTHQNRAEDRVYRWEGPDGSQVWMKWDQLSGTGQELGGYAEAFKLLKGTFSERVGLILELIDTYRSAPGYNFDAIALLGMSGDVVPFPRSNAVSDFIAEFRRSFPSAAQPAAYPKLVNATWEEFYDHLERFVARFPGTPVPVIRGDYGTSWEEAVGSMPAVVARWKRTSALLEDAEAIDALVLSRDPAEHVDRQAAIEEGYRNLLLLPEHSWANSLDQTAENVSANKWTWSVVAEDSARVALDSGLTTLGSLIATPAGRSVLVVNTLGFARTGVVTVPVPAAGPYTVRDLSTGAAVPWEPATTESSAHISFEAASVPAIGYKVFSIVPGGVNGARRVTVGPDSIETPTHRITIRAADGEISSLRDLRSGKEFALQGGLNGAQIESLGTDSVVLRPGQGGALTGTFKVERRMGGHLITTTYRASSSWERLEIENRLQRKAGTNIRQLDYSFVFDVPEPALRYSTPGALTRFGFAEDGGDQIPGADVARLCATGFLDFAAGPGDRGVILLQPDTLLFRVGASGHEFADLRRSTVFIEAIHRRGTALTDVPFTDEVLNRFAVRTYSGVQDGALAAREAQDHARPFLVVDLPPSQRGDLPAGAHQLLPMDLGSCVVTSIKAGEEGGLILRLWETSGRQSTVTLDLARAGQGAWATRTDLLERNLEEIPVAGGAAELSVPAWGLAAARVEASAPFLISTSDLPPGQTEQPYGPLALASSGGEPPVRWWFSSGALPSGITLAESGVLEGSPRETGAYAFQVRARDAAGRLAARELLLAVSDEASGVRSLRVLGPNGGEVLRGLQQVRWNAAGQWPVGSTVSVRLLPSGGLPAVVLAEAVPVKQGALGWESSGVADGPGYRLEITSVGDPQILDRSDAPFTVDNTPPPPPALLSPIDGATGITTSPELQGLEAPDALSGIPSTGGYRFEITAVGNGSSILSPWLDRPSWRPSGLSPAAAYRFRMRTRDRAGGESQDSPAWTFHTVGTSELNVEATQDAHLVEAFPDHNTGASPELEIGRFEGADANDDTSVLLRFDLSGLPPGTTAVAAEVHVAVLGADGGEPTRTISAFRLRRAWNEGSGVGTNGSPAQNGNVTWFDAKHGQVEWSAPGAAGAQDRDGAPLDTREVPPTPGEVSWNVFPAVADWLRDPGANAGLLLVDTGARQLSGLIRMASRESPLVSSRPRLVLTLEARTFERGRINADTKTDLADAVTLLAYLFLGGVSPGCLDAADINDDGQLDISDGISLLGYLFLGSAPPPAPFGAPGNDPTPDALGCEG